VRLGKNASDTCTLLFKAYGGNLWKSRVFSSVINGSERFMRTWKMMEEVVAHDLTTSENVEKVQSVVHSGCHLSLLYGNIEATM